MKGLAPKFQLNTSKGIQQYVADLVQGELGLNKAEGLLSDIPPALRVPRGTTTKFSTIGYSDKPIASIHTIYKTISGVESVKIVTRPTTSTDIAKTNTGTAGAAENVTGYTNIPNAAMLYSSAYFREELILASENSYPASLVIDSDGNGVTASSLTGAPKGGVAAGHQNRLWITGCSTDIEHTTLTIPLTSVGYGSGMSKRFEVLATDIDLGHVVVFGATSYRAVQIWNGTAVPVKLTGATCAGTDFIVVNTPQLPCTVPPGGLVTIEIQCIPESDGLKQGTLLISTNMATIDSSSTSWTHGTLKATVTLSDTVLENQLAGCYLVNTDNTLQYEIVSHAAGKTALDLILNSNSIANPGTAGWKILVDPTLTIPITAHASYDPFTCSPNFAHFGMVIKGADIADYPYQTITIPNPMNNSFLFGKPALACGSPARFTITHFSYDDVNWITFTDPNTDTVGDLDDWDDYADANGFVTVAAKKSLRLKIKPNENTAIGVNEYNTGLTIAGKEAAQSNRVWFSELKQSNTFIKARDYIDFTDNEGDGGRTTALVPFSDALWIFCRNAIWVITGYSAETFRRQELPNGKGIGIINPRAWCIKDGILYFASYSGIFAGMGYQALPISQPIQNEMANIVANPGSVEMAVGGDFVFVSCKYTKTKEDFGYTFTFDADTSTVTVAGAGWTVDDWNAGYFYDKNGHAYLIEDGTATTLILAEASITANGAPEAGPFIVIDNETTTHYAVYAYNTITRAWTKCPTNMNRMCSSFESDGKPKLLMCKDTLGTADVVASFDTAASNFTGYNDVTMEWGWDNMQNPGLTKIVESIFLYGGNLSESGYECSLWFQSENDTNWKAATMLDQKGTSQIQHRTFILGPRSYGVFWRFKFLMKNAKYNSQLLGFVANWYQQADTAANFR